MRRRIQLPNELPDRSYNMSPRKQRGYGPPGVFLQQGDPTTAKYTLPAIGMYGQRELYNKHRHFVPQSSGSIPKHYATNYRWLTAQVGKVFIPTGYVPYSPEKNNYVFEKDIAIYAKPYNFNILYAGRTKPMYDYLPEQLNVVLNEKNVIIEVYYG